MDKFTVVLARPAGPGNVGSISRLCANFGCRKLRIVSPCFDFNAALKEGLNSEMGWYSRHQGLEILEQCTIVSDDMDSALVGCTRVVGFSRRRGRNRSGVSQMDVGAMYEGTQVDSSVALLFGNESDGLTTEELSSATDIVEIPTAAAQGSMNLSHAVAVSLARLFDDCVRLGEWDDSLGGDKTVRGPPARENELATVDDVRSLQERLAAVLGEGEAWPSRSARARTIPDSEMLARILTRGRPTKGEIRYLHGLVTKMTQPPMQ